MHSTKRWLRAASPLLCSTPGTPTRRWPSQIPKPSRYDFDKFDNVRATPHMSGWTEGLMERRYRAMADNLQRFSRGEPLLNVVWRDGHAA